MANVGDIEYTVSVETQQSISAAQQFDKQMDQVQDSARKTDKELGKLDTGFSKLATAIKGVIAVSALKSMAGMVQEYQTMAERVKMATRSTEEFETVQNRLQTTADGTYRSLAEAQELYIRTADSIRSMGYSLSETIDIQDSMSYAFVANATSADRAQSAISQFTKSINTGKVSADQWETISSAIPTIMNDIAAASGKSASEVRALGSAGKLTARELTEGLRKSLDETRAAADGMATDLIDASVRAKNAITTVLVGLENQAGAIQAVTDGIIIASEAMLEFGQDAEKMEAFLKLTTVAGASLAAVMAGRMLTAMVAGTQALYANTIAARAKAAAELQAAQTAAALANQNLVQAQTAARAAAGLGHQAQAAAALTAAESAATAATARLTLAQTAMRGALTVSAVAANGLRAAMAFLGGPAGLVMLAAVAIYSFASSARSATKPTDELTSSVSELGKEMGKVRLIDINKKISELDKLAAQIQRNIKWAERTVGISDKGIERLQRQRGALEENRKEVERLRAAIVELESLVSDEDSDEDSPEPTTTPEGQKRLQAMRDEIELAEKVGVAKARLAAVQHMGAEATKEERAEAEQLATDLYNLKEAQDAAKKATEAAGKAAEEAAQKKLDAAKSDKEVLAALTEQLYQTTLEADALRDRKAELMLSGYADDDQIKEVQRLAKALEEAEKKTADLEKRKAEAEQVKQAAAAIDPMEAERQRFQERMAQIKLLEESEAISAVRLAELKLQTQEDYHARIAELQEEEFRRQSLSNDLLMSQLDRVGEAATGAFTGLLTGATNGKEAVQQLAQAILQDAVGALVQMGVEQVKQMVMGQTAQAASAATAAATGAAMAASYTPAAIAANIASYGAAATAGMASMASAIPAMKGMLALSGARRQGGPVSPGSMYRVNEGGRPEVFQNNMGQQYMIPNERGKVVSNRDAQGGGGVVVNIHNAPQGTRTEKSESPTGEQMIDIWIADFTADGRTASVVQNKFGLAAQGR